METPKEKAIREAYGYKWDIAKNFVDENGWIDRFKQSAYLNIGNWGIDDPPPIINFLGFRDAGGLQYNDNKYRPSILNRIEDNLGWISIGSQVDLPKYDTYCHVNTVGGKITIAWYNYTEFRFFDDQGNNWLWNAITHYQPIDKPKPPIY